MAFPPRVREDGKHVIKALSDNHNDICFLDLDPVFSELGLNALYIFSS